MGVVLIGPSLPGVENHAIGALRSALRSSGLPETFVAFDGFAHLERTVRRVLANRPQTVGVSLQTIESALATTAFTMLLRRRGFEGRTIVGGHFATLNAEALLRSPAEIDAVVQFAGEEALVAVARGVLDHPELAREVPGLVFRDERGEIQRGASPRWTSPAVSSRMPRFEPLPLHLGFPSADLVVSRGCAARCSYCCIAAASELARRSGTNDGHESRSVSSLADEMAALYHEQGARVFNFMDDNILPLDPDAAARWAADLKQALDARHVGAVALSTQLRADVVTEESARALSDVGLSRAYVGVDGYSASQLRVLGRKAETAAGPRALEILWRRGIFSVVNALLVGPTIPFESILNEVEALGRIAHAPVHLLPIEVRAGTAYFRAAQRKGLVEGGFLHWHYRFLDERTEQMATILTSLPTRLAERSVPIALYDLGYNLGIARRLLPEIDLASHAATYARVTAAWNADQSRLLRAAVAVASRRDAAAARAFVAEQIDAVTALDGSLRDACDRSLAELERAVARVSRRAVSAHARGKLLGAVAFSMSLAACGTLDETASENDASVGSAASGAAGALHNGTGGIGIVASGGAGAAAQGGSGGTLPVATGGAAQGGSGGTLPVATGGAASSADASAAGAGSGGSSGGSPLGGAAGIAGSEGDASTATCSKQHKDWSTPGFCSCDGVDPSITFDSEGRAVAFASEDGAALSGEIVDCLTALFAPYCYPSFANTTQPFRAHCWIA